MSFKHWVEETKNRFDRESPPVAVYESVHALATGGLRRVYDYYSSPIWIRGDWDIVLILDATRVDLMREVGSEYGFTEIDSVWSNANCSINWLENTFNRHPEHTENTGYIISNPFAKNNSPSDPSADVHETNLSYFAPLYENKLEKIDDGPVETIPPEALTDHAISVWRDREEYDIDRLVVHYMQPHQPFRSRPEWLGTSENMKQLVEGESRTDYSDNVWRKLERGELDENKVWDAYRDNLRWVLDDIVDRLLENIDAEVAITSDHGNALGEWGEWAHPPDAVSPPVWRVLWVTTTGVDNETISSIEVDTEGFDPEIEDQLSALGYV